MDNLNPREKPLEVLDLSYTELRPETRYKMRELIPKYYMLLGAIAAIAESDNQEWHKIYSQRLKEIEEEIANAFRDNPQPS